LPLRRLQFFTRSLGSCACFAAEGHSEQGGYGFAHRAQASIHASFC
jgi:hypothetical protein